MTANGPKTLLLLRTGNEYGYEPDFAERLKGHWQVTLVPEAEIPNVDLTPFRVVYVPTPHDQILMQRHTQQFLDYLAGGGNLLINGHIVRPWLPFLNRFQAVPPRPFTNLMIRPHTPGPYLGRMDFETFHRHGGILGHYARGWSDPPDGAQLLAMIGPPDDLKPVDWVWRFPGGGKVFMHNGDGIHWFQSQSRDEPNLTREVLDALADPNIGPFDTAGRGAA